MEQASPSHALSAPKRAWLVLPTLNRYQSARYQAFASGRRDDTGVFEIAGGGSYPIPGWRSPTADALPGVVTLFQGVKYGEINRRLLHRKILSELSARQAQIEVVGVLGWDDPAALSALHWAARHGVPAIIMSDSNEFDATRFWIKEWVKRRVVALCSSGLVAGTTARDYLAALGLSKCKVFLGYDVVDNEYFARRAEEVRGRRSEVRRKYGLPERFFLASGRFVEKKNLPRLLQAYAHYRTLCQKSVASAQWSGDPWSLVLLGDGPLKAQLNSQLSTLNLQPFVHLPGAKAYEELPAYYGLASAFVHASTVEQWGLVVNEAMASGLPVLVSNRCGCAPDLVQEGINGFTFNPVDVEQLADLMLRLTTVAPPRLVEMGSASQNTIRGWGPSLFVRGLSDAVDLAMRVGPQKPSILTSLLIKLLLLR